MFTKIQLSLTDWDVDPVEMFFFLLFKVLRSDLVWAVPSTGFLLTFACQFGSLSKDEH
jgi:hypothetical protein